MAVYLLFTRSYGIVQKVEDDIKAARQWTARALPRGEVVSVTRLHNVTTGIALEQLETEWRATVARMPAAGEAVRRG